MGAYEFGADAEREKQRLAAVERAFDPVSQWALSRAGVRPGWRCWEVGAGNGSIARWLARVVGSEGFVLATDLDHEHFAAGEQSLSFMRHDVVDDPLPEERFDLIHARFLLEHLPDPPFVIARLRDALRPGGVMVLEDSDGLQLDLIPASSVFAQLAPAWELAARAVGWDPSYGRTLASDLRAARLGELSGHEYRQLARGGAQWAHLKHGLERLRDGLIERGITEAELHRAVGCLMDPGRLITGPPVTIVWGRR